MFSREHIAKLKCNDSKTSIKSDKRILNYDQFSTTSESFCFVCLKNFRYLCLKDKIA